MRPLQLGSDRENETMTPPWNSIIHGDCVDGLSKVSPRSVDLAFADPPFNIGYEYDGYHDRKSTDDYVDWCRIWMTEVARVLKPGGAFWLAIGDEYAAELKILATRDLGLTCRNWIVWYYTFGVHCKSKFTRSHAHVFYFVVDPKRFTFNDHAIRVPSARQLVYADKRADPRGRLPDDTWIIPPAEVNSWVLRPQDLPRGFSADSDTWYIPRVCGTFKERAGFHGCQMPEQLLGRIIRASSNPGDVVLDPFVGSGTTLAVAKKLGRRYLGFEISARYVREANRRLRKITVADSLAGVADPLASARPTVAQYRARHESPAPTRSARRPTQPGTVRPFAVKCEELRAGVTEAFKKTRRGFSCDRVIADPDLNARFVSTCQRLSMPGDATSWNKTLLALRKTNRLESGNTKRTLLSAERLHACEFASEIALTRVTQLYDASLDEMLCNPAMVAQFDTLACELAPGFDLLYYRWAALGLRKRATLSRKYATRVAKKLKNSRFANLGESNNLNMHEIAELPALFLIKGSNCSLYVGETDNMFRWVTRGRESGAFDAIQRAAGSTPVLATLRLDFKGIYERRGAQSYEIGRKEPIWNFPELKLSAAELAEAA